MSLELLIRPEGSCICGNKMCFGLHFIQFLLKRTLVITKVFVTRDFAVKSNLLL